MQQQAWDSYLHTKTRKPLYSRLITINGINYRARFDEIVRPHLSTDTVLLDVGCGFADHLIKYSSGAKAVYGVDLNWRLLLEAKSRCISRPEISIAQMDSRQLGIKDCSFDLVTSVFNPVEPETVRETYRVLKPGGMYLRVSSGGDFVNYGGKLLTRRQDVAGRGAYYDCRPGQLMRGEIALVRDCEYTLPESNISIFTGMKAFQSIDDLIDHTRNSGHFRLSAPFTPLNDREIAKFRENKSRFIVSYQDETAYAIPFDSFLLIAQKH